ncbi:hypothetical protein [Methylobacterium nonmethylotrophicum]|uniref:Uncharacterized protein n=1 Tax=Methylobacterium nonmethylotrophicum TaxID=1141884 RepID=A0A4Z0NPG6_9HYPH|nr:hypothetical protein [Methylobacterium nonmethylotrophicum]TGD98729.1 hypothetical protein EU555_15465 [Methylobacterium nonmethylotrophicum]
MTYDTISALAEADRSSAAVKAENILRQRLRISNPHDPREVIEGLRRLFPDQAAALDREASGLPSGLADLYPRPVAVPVAGMAASEFDRARDAIETDLRALATDNQLREVDAEIEGWGQAIRTLLVNGRNAAQMALDPRARDRALAVRRQLCDYARMVRLAGASNPAANPAYRRLAQGIDTAAALILVASGEALAELGIAGGQIVLTAPVGELQARRDAIVIALRTLNGTADGAGDDFPRGVYGLRTLLHRLREGGNAELLAYLDETIMARTLDDLIDYAANGTGRGMRVLSAAAAVPLAHLTRVAEAAGDVDRGSPAISRLTHTLALFIDAFQQSPGHRLQVIARPALLRIGQQGSGIRDDGASRLVGLVEARGDLVQRVDCLMGCDCERQRIAGQIVVDGLLAGIDRAIDLYTVGTDPDGQGDPERRAVAYGLLCTVLCGFISEAEHPRNAADDAAETEIGRVLAQARRFHETIRDLARLLVGPWRHAADRPRTIRLVRSELFAYWRAEGHWLDAAPRFAGACTIADRGVPGARAAGPRDPVTNPRAVLRTLVLHAFEATGDVPDGLVPLTHRMTDHEAVSLETIACRL